MHGPYSLSVQDASFALQNFPFTFRPAQTGNNPLREPRVFLFGDRGQDRDDRVAEQSRSIEILLTVTLPAHTVAIEQLQVLERLERALAAESVQSPEKNNIEPSLPRILEHLQERGTVGALVPLMRSLYST